MSFIYSDKNLLNELFKAGQAPNNEALELAKKLVKNLQTQARGGTVFTSDKPDANLDQIDLSGRKDESTLSNLIYFLSYNGIQANDIKIVLKAPVDLDVVANGKLYVPYPEKDAAQYYVYKDGLVKYLNDLKKRATGNPLFLANIAKLQQSINEELPEVASRMQKQPRSQDPRQPGGHARQPGGRTQDLHKFLNNFPLLEDRVDYQRIERFIDSYSQITGESSALVNAIDQSLTFIHTHFGNAGAVAVPLSNLEEIAAMLPQNPPADPRALVSQLYSLIVNVKLLLTHLKSIAYNQMDEALQQQIDKQVGTSEEDGNSIAVNNLDRLKDLRNTKWVRTT